MMFVIRSMFTVFAGPFFGMGIPELIVILLIIAIVAPSIVALYRKARSNSGSPAPTLSAGTVGSVPSDAPSMGYAVLGFFIPLTGLILYLVQSAAQIVS
jgi:hypothetical protein